MLSIMCHTSTFTHNNTIIYETLLSTYPTIASFLPVFSFFIAMWSVSMLEFWKRKEKTTALKWGSIDFEQSEADRPGR